MNKESLYQVQCSIMYTNQFLILKLQNQIRDLIKKNEIYKKSLLNISEQFCIPKDYLPVDMRPEIPINNNSIIMFNDIMIDNININNMEPLMTADTKKELSNLINDYEKTTPKLEENEIKFAIDLGGLDEDVKKEVIKENTKFMENYIKELLKESYKGISHKIILQKLIPFNKYIKTLDLSDNEKKELVLYRRKLKNRIYSARRRHFHQQIVTISKKMLTNNI